MGSSHMARLERIVARLPDAQRVDIERWGDEVVLDQDIAGTNR